jgi:hypothetical protein
VDRAPQSWPPRGEEVEDGAPQSWPPGEKGLWMEPPSPGPQGRRGCGWSPPSWAPEETGLWTELQAFIKHPLKPGPEGAAGTDRTLIFALPGPQSSGGQIQRG